MLAMMRLDPTGRSLLFAAVEGEMQLGFTAHLIVH